MDLSQLDHLLQEISKSLNVYETRYIKELPEWQASLGKNHQPLSSTDCVKFSDEYEKRIREASKQDEVTAKDLQRLEKIVSDLHDQTREREEKLKVFNASFQHVKQEFKKWLEEECKSKSQSRKRKEPPVPTRRKVLDAKARNLFTLINHEILWKEWDKKEENLLKSIGDQLKIYQKRTSPFFDTQSTIEVFNAFGSPLAKISKELAKNGIKTTVDPKGMFLMIDLE